MKKRTTVEIYGTGVHNRGAELMAAAVAAQLRERIPNVQIAVTPQFGGYDARLRYGFVTTDEFIERRLWSWFASSIPKSFRRHFGVIRPGEVDVVLDASGFAYSDQWGAAPAAKLRRRMSKPSRSKQPLFLLPQAFGPFRNRKVADHCMAIFRRAEIICARDERSYDHVKDLWGTEKLLRYPDFTISVEAIQRRRTENTRAFAAIVPNVRMLDKTSDGEQYLVLLSDALESVRKANIEPVFIQHDLEADAQVISRLDPSNRCEIVRHEDPRVLKGTLGEAIFVVGSRFHALVSAFSQGVPCLGLGWSHKYRELFRDFGVEDLLLDDMVKRDRFKELLGSLVDCKSRNVLSRRILECGERQRECSKHMWEVIDSKIRTSIF